jgi:hypothetical protein
MTAPRVDGDKGIEPRGHALLHARAGREMTPPAAFPNGDPPTSLARPVDPAPTHGWDAGCRGGVSGRTTDADRVSGRLRGVQDGRGTVIPTNGDHHREEGESRHAEDAFAVVLCV